MSPFRQRERLTELKSESANVRLKNQKKQKAIRSCDAKTSLALVLISDTHEFHREITVPRADLLLCSGDFTMFSRSLRAIVDFNEWLGELPHRYRVIVPGNHETFLQTNASNRSLLSNAVVLINEGVEIEGLRIWGTPVTAGFGPAFGIRSAEQRRRLYAKIPNGTDILITHGPPYGILDCSLGSSVHQGDPVLFEAVKRVRPKLHLFGHIHGAHGIYETENTTFLNAALLGPDGDIAKEPVVLRMTRQ